MQGKSNEKASKAGRGERARKLNKGRAERNREEEKPVRRMRDVRRNLVVRMCEHHLHKGWPEHGGTEMRRQKPLRSDARGERNRERTMRPTCGRKERRE